MKNFYKIFTYLLEPFLRIILKRRITAGKEDSERYAEKLGETKLKSCKNIIWFHVASLGEIKSIAPLIMHYQKNKDLKILITTVTISSFNFFKKNLDFENTIHQYAPLDGPTIVSKFINHWKPKVSIFVESEIWPNLIYETSKLSKLILLNCRISKDSFAKWKIFKKFFKNIILSFDAITVQNEETKKYLEYFNIKNINNFGNLKFIHQNNNRPNFLNIKNLENSWAAMSIHFEEVKNIIEVHQSLMKKYSRITSFIIPRHLNKIDQIKQMFKDKDLEFKLTSEESNIDNYNGIILVDQFDIADDIFNKVKIVFMGGSFIKHGGQNPIEAARFNCKIFHGNHIFNFTEIYNFLEKNNISKLTINTKELTNEIINYLENRDVNQNKISINLSDKIFSKTINFLDNYIL
jgi:3-deoxy-D-manno-octulosonic-acid transferase